MEKVESKRGQTRLFSLKQLRIISYYLVALFLLNLCFAEETYNLEILFRCTAWDSYPDLSYFGLSLAGGDVNGDEYSDIAVEATHYVEYNENFGIDVYIFFGAPVMDTIYDAVLHCPEHLGHSPSGLCISDVSGDSIGDVIVGDHGGAGGGGDAWIFFGGSPFDTIADLHLVGEASGSAFGDVVAAGDVNGDGYNDIIVGAYAYNGISLDGRVYVYYGGVLLDTIPDITISGSNSESMGTSVGSGGDLNNDGFEDIVIGAHNNSEAGAWAGKVYVFFGGDPMDTIPDSWLHGEGFGHFLGLSGCDIMEVDNEFGMVITGTSLYPDGFPNPCPGKVYILYGGDPMDTLPDLWMIGQYDASKLGMWCCSAGDVNGDGYEDAMAGAPNDYYSLGTGYVWLGGMPMDTVVDAYLRGGYAPQQIGWYVASAGDVNGDSYDDMIFSNYVGADPAVWVCKYTGTTVTEQSEYGAVLAKFAICPNPFSKQTHISFSFEQSPEGKAQLKIYDISGRLVKDFSRQLSVIGHRSSVVWDGKDDAGHSVPKGIYFVRLETPGFVETEKIIHLK